MSWIDWIILIIPVCFVIFMGFYCRKYIRSVSDYLSGGRLCGRYVLSLGDIASALSVIGLLAFIEIRYKTGFALSFWGNLLLPVTTLLALTGFCVYRFRETRAMSLGQFIELRYGSRKLRVFSASLRSLAEMLANMIMPALAARFFIQMLNLPDKIYGIPTFDILIVLFLTLAITLICLGGTLSLVITDTIQGMILYPLLICFIVFLMCKFSFSEQIMPVMTDRVQGESFLNPFDISELRDFNFFSMVIVALFYTIMHRASWMGGGADTAARSAHEQKMAGLLSCWRICVINVFYVIVAVGIITFMNHKDFANEANAVRKKLVLRVSNEIIHDQDKRVNLNNTISAIPPQIHTIGLNAPPSQENNQDTAFLQNIHATLLKGARKDAETKLNAENTELCQNSSTWQDHVNKTIIEEEGKANDLFQQCRTLYHQQMLAVAMRQMLPPGLFGAFCLLLFLAMLSTDDTRIYSAALTISQDCVFPFYKEELTPEKHIKMIRIVSICVGVFFALGSHFMAQLDYINLFVTLACAMWLSGSAPVMTFGLYWKKGTVYGAWAALLNGMISSILYILVQRNWADVVYPALAKANMVESTDKLLKIISSPFGSWISWKMDAVKCPVNSYEFTFFASVFSILLYIIISLLTCKKDFNMDKMLHRGEYEDPNEPPKNLKIDWSIRNIFKNLISITPEYTKGDRFIAYSTFIYSFVYSFIVMFVGILIWNAVTPWTIEYWQWYFYIYFFAVPGLIAGVSLFWFGIGGIKDIRRLFHDLKTRTQVNILDDGRVEHENESQD